MDSAADAFASGEIDRAQLTRITSSLRPELEEAEQATARAVRGVAPKLVAEMAGKEAATRWSALTVEQRRALLEALRMRVRLMPTRRGAGFVPEDVHIEWLGGAR